LAGVLFLAASGCGQGDRPDLAPVEGTVMLDGNPLARATVVFRPTEGKDSRAITDANGHYELFYLRDIKGAIPSGHTVRITTATEDAPQERLPDRYHRNTVLTAEVKAGETNEIPFALESD